MALPSAAITRTTTTTNIAFVVEVQCTVVVQL